jgi:Multiubiquitin
VGIIKDNESARHRERELAAENSDEEFDANAERRDRLVRRACTLMGWKYRTGPVWGGIRKFALAEAVVISLEKLEEILDRLETLPHCPDVQLDQPSTGPQPDAHERTVTVTVNEQPVRLEGKTETGAQIKAAAIKQGVHIQQNFVLQEELPNWTSKVIGDNDVVHLREHLRFTAIAPDDNS